MKYETIRDAISKILEENGILDDRSLIKDFADEIANLIGSLNEGDPKRRQKQSNILWAGLIKDLALGECPSDLVVNYLNMVPDDLCFLESLGRFESAMPGKKSLESRINQIYAQTMNGEKTRDVIAELLVVLLEWQDFFRSEELVNRFKKKESLRKLMLKKVELYEPDMLKRVFLEIESGESAAKLPDDDPRLIAKLRLIKLLSQPEGMK